MIDDVVRRAYELAVSSRENAYAPYSNFQVGAALKLKGHDKIYSGCNVENASFGSTVCAERNAIFSSVVDQGRNEIEFIVIVTNTTPPTVPCALCLQVLAEFAKPDLPIYLANEEGIKDKVEFKDLLPQPFNSF
jgi:cytidine deaminase